MQRGAIQVGNLINLKSVLTIYGGGAGSVTFL